MIDYTAPGVYNTWNSQHVGEGRKHKFGEETFVYSTRLPMSIKDDLQQARQQVDLASELRNVINNINKRK
jgi:hypothetical protein